MPPNAMNSMLKRLFWGVLLGSTLLGCGERQQKPAETPNAAHGPLDLGLPTGPDLAKFESAVAAMDRGDTERSIRALEELRTRHPENGAVLHELAVAYRLAKKPGAAVDLLLPYRERLPVESVSNLGTALDEVGRSSEAISVLEEGLRRFPSSGLLHADLGTTVLGQGKLEEALKLFQKGMAVDPAAPANYIRMSLVLSRTHYRGLTLVFGETFRLLEPTSPRSYELARLMVEVCRDSVKRTPGEGGEVQATVSLAPTVTIERPEQVADLPLVNVFELTFGPPLVRAHRDGLSLATLHKARVEFVESMNAPENPFDWNAVPVFRFMREASANGMLEVYDYWLFGPAFPEEFGVWAKANQGTAETLGRYVAEHPLLFPRAVAR